jgi:hypothetical protein
MPKSEKTKLSSFMQKQVSKKSADTNLHSHKSTEVKKPDNQDDDQNPQGIEQEMTEEEKLEEAKKASRNKASTRDQIEMFKKLIIETVVKYTAIFITLALFSFGLIKFGPAILEFLHGLIFKIFMGSINHK